MAKTAAEVTAYYAAKERQAAQGALDTLKIYNRRMQRQWEKTTTEALAALGVTEAEAAMAIDHMGENCRHLSPVMAANYLVDAIF
jgi:hypothetical protein